MDSFTNRMDYLVQKNNKNHVFLKHRSMAFKRSAVRFRLSLPKSLSIALLVSGVAAF